MAGILNYKSLVSCIGSLLMYRKVHDAKILHKFEQNNLKQSNKVRPFYPFFTPGMQLTSNFSKVIYGTDNDATELQQKLVHESLELNPMCTLQDINNPSRASSINRKTIENVRDAMRGSDGDKNLIRAHAFKPLYCMDVWENEEEEHLIYIDVLMPSELCANNNDQTLRVAEV